MREFPVSPDNLKIRSSDRWLVPFVFLVTFITYYLGAYPLMDDSDVPWHLAAGRLLLQTHQLPETDPWSFGSAGQPWYLLSWLWDLLLGVIERSFGPFGVFLFTIGACSTLTTFLARRLMGLRIARPAIYLTLILASLCILDFITARPHLAGYGFALIFHAILHTSRSSGKYGRLLYLPILMLVWVNTHGSFIAGFTILAAFIIEGWATWDAAWLKRLLIISGACAFAALFNPYSIDVLTGAMRTLGGGAIKYTLEWLPFTFTSSLGISTWLIVFILASNLRATTAPLADKILAVAWLFATFYIIRNGAICILLSAPYLAACLDEQTRGLRENRNTSILVQFMEKQKLSHIWLASLGGVALFTLGVWFAPHENRLLSKDASAYDAIDYALKKYSDHHFLTDFNFGGQVIYHTDGKLPFFMDSRAATAYGEQAMRDYLDFLWLKPGWEKEMTDRGVDGIIISHNSKFANAYADGLLHDRWQLVFAGNMANVYIIKP